MTPDEIARLLNHLDHCLEIVSGGDAYHEYVRAQITQAAAALRSLAQELERTKDDLRRIQSVYDFAKLSAERDSLAQEVERLKTEHINAEMAHGALHAIHELLDDGGVPRGTFADDHVRNLVAMYNQRGMRIRELEAEHEKMLLFIKRCGLDSVFATASVAES